MLYQQSGKILTMALYVLQGGVKNKASKEGSKALPRQREL